MPLCRRGKWESDVEQGNVLAAAEPLREIGATGWKSSTATACGDCTERGIHRPGPHLIASFQRH